MAEKKGIKKYQFLIFGLCSLLALALCMVVLVVTVKTVEKDNTGTAEYETKSKTELTDDTAVLLGYIKTLTEETAGNKFIKADVYTDISVDDASLTLSPESEADKKLLIYAKNKMLPSVDGYYPQDIKGVFGSVYEAMPVIDLSPELIANSRYCVGEADENGNPVYNTDTGELIDADYYFISFELDYAAVDSPAVRELFKLDSKQEIAEKFSADISDVCKINSAEAVPSLLKISAKINRFSDKIEYIDFEKLYTISADVSFENDLSVFGSKQLSFSYSVKERLEYRYAGISFSESTVTVEPGAELALSVAAVIENDSEYTVTFASSDETVATVDEMGYVKGISSSCNPVTITVTLEYLGEKFTDECTVIVNDDSKPNG